MSLVPHGIIIKLTKIDLPIHLKKYKDLIIVQNG